MDLVLPRILVGSTGHVCQSNQASRVTSVPEGDAEDAHKTVTGSQPAGGARNARLGFATLATQLPTVFWWFFEPSFI